MSPPAPVDFVCFGMLKAGTTMLQRMLNMHPRVSCPSQISVELIQEHLQTMAAACNEKMTGHDERTGGQGVSMITEETVKLLSREAIARIARDAGAGKSIIGVKDNRLMRRPELLAEVFPGAKIIVIFRHPVDQAVSAWHFNHRAAERADDPDHLQEMLKHGGQEGWIILLARLFAFLTKDLLEACHGRELLMVRYEELAVDREQGLERLFDFLGAESDRELVTEIAQKASFARMRDGSSDPSFFHRGAEGYEVSQSIRARAEEIAGDAMRRVGYRL